MYWTLELASYLEDTPWPATKDELIDFSIRSVGISSLLDLSESPQMDWETAIFRNSKSIDYENRYTELTYGYEEDKVDYSTRASSVWISTENGWKIMHSSWAPFGGGNGIPNK